MKGTISFQFSIDFHKSENCMEFFMCIAPPDELWPNQKMVYKVIVKCSTAENDKYY